MAGFEVGYARISPISQSADLEAQAKDLAVAGCHRIFREEIVSSDPSRPQMNNALDVIGSGDTLVVTKLDRLARSMADLMDILARLKVKGAQLRVLALNLDTGTPQGELMVDMMRSIAQFERDLVIERQREGIAKAKIEGRFVGRAPTARRKTDEVMRLSEQGHKARAIANQLKISETSVFRILRAISSTEKTATADTTPNIQ